jgi:putative transposase
MRYTAAEKLEIIRLVEDSELGVKRTLAEMDVPRANFYRWYQAYAQDGVAGLESKPGRQTFWNRISQAERERVVTEALAKPELSSRELAWHITDTQGYFISESSVYRILKAFDLVTSPNFIVLSARDQFQHQTRRVHELWQTDFTYFKVIGWGWYYLLTILDDYSRFILAWKLYTTMQASDVTELLEDTIKVTAVNHIAVRHRPRLLSDNGPSFRAQELSEYLAKHGMGEVHGKPYHPQTQGKIERYHRSMKNVVKLENYYLPGELELSIGNFVEHYNHKRYHESLDNLTPADVYLGRAASITQARDRLKAQTLLQRKRYNRGLAFIRRPLILPDEYRKVSLRKSTHVSQIA